MRACRASRPRAHHRFLPLALEPRDDFTHPNALLFRQRRCRPADLPGCRRNTRCSIDAVRHDLTHYPSRRLAARITSGHAASIHRSTNSASREEVIDCGIVRNLTAAWSPVARAIGRHKTHAAYVNCRQALLSSNLTAHSSSVILNIINTLLRIVIGTTLGCWNRQCDTCN